jgi:nicotinate-nucleotide adenylyltransferase
MKIGVFGGTFDPIHNGHLTIAEEVRTQLALKEVWFVPTGHPWLKVGRVISPWEQRVQMIELAIYGRPYFRLSTIEASRPGPSYTIDTIIELKRQLKTAELFFIMGWDSLNSLPLWKESNNLITLCRLVAVPRPGGEPPDLMVLDEAVPGLSQNVIMLSKPQLDISATEIRARVAQSIPIDGMVPLPVLKYIQQNRLYVESTESR